MVTMALFVEVWGQAAHFCPEEFDRLTGVGYLLRSRMLQQSYGS